MGGVDWYPFADLIRATVHTEDSSPIEIAKDKEERETAKKRWKIRTVMFDNFYSEILTKKQYEIWNYNTECY